MEFRKDINGLRALAVIGVVLYHFDLARLSGGFAGVDVFFVISGFLMTGIILSRLQAGKFSLREFYLARARRIVPALAVLCLTLLAAGYFWLIPTDFEKLGRHAAASATFVSNFIFKGEEGYFDAPSRDKWLLHTWSLSVEWQFYLVYPLFLMAALRFAGKRVAAALAGLALVSLAVSVHFTPLKSAFAFYILPTRIWEFMLGGLAYVWSASVAPQRRAALNFLGLALVIAPFFLFSSDTPWPGHAALVPVLGAALVIFARHEDSVITGNAVMQAVGKWSYSIYLWHWPVYVGLGYFGVRGGAWTGFGVAASLILGAASYYFIETPFRKKAVRALPLAGLAAVAACLGAAVFTGDGLKSRVSPDILRIESAEESKYQTDKGCGFKGAGKIDRCFVGKGDGIRFALWGDSHAGSVATALAEAAKGRGIIHTLGCPVIFDTRLRRKAKAPCKEFTDTVFADVKTLPKDVPVIIAARLSYYLLGFNEGVKKTIGLDYIGIPDAEVRKDEGGVFKRRLTESLCAIAKERDLYVMTPIPEMGQDVPKTLARRLMTGQDAPDIAVSRADYDARHAVVTAALEDARACGVRVLDTAAYLCKDGQCLGSINHEPLYFDDDHLNEWGNKKLVPMFEKIFEGGTP